jgi:glutamate N-acetyltransferase/amino-acid N-acetyltransferase
MADSTTTNAVKTRHETFFRSRWVERPGGVSELEPTRLPAGFRAAGVAYGYKPSGRPDLGVLVCDADETASAALFTRNAVVAAPVVVSRHAELSRLRAVVANSGNANVGAGEEGLRVAEAMTSAVASGLDVPVARVGVASTGIIGIALEREPLLAGIEQALGVLSADGGGDFAEAIMTSDRWPKRASLEIELARGRATLSAQAKGAGMISPSFATMLCFVETDAVLDRVSLEHVLRGAVERSFERISVDGQLSTNDSIFAIGSGVSGVVVEPGTDDERRFASALGALLRQLAIEIVADGEGTKRVARLVVRGPVEAVEPVARAVADSPLVKCALHGGDPNWGRILQAAGQALIDGSGSIDLAIEHIAVARAGVEVPLGDDERRGLEEAMRRPEIEIVLALPGGDDETEIFFCDLGPDYVSFNSEYST